MDKERLKEISAELSSLRRELASSDEDDNASFGDAICALEEIITREKSATGNNGLPEENEATAVENANLMHENAILRAQVTEARLAACRFRLKNRAIRDVVRAQEGEFAAAEIREMCRVRSWDPEPLLQALRGSRG